MVHSLFLHEKQPHVVRHFRGEEVAEFRGTDTGAFPVSRPADYFFSRREYRLLEIKAVSPGVRAATPCVLLAKTIRYEKAILRGPTASSSLNPESREFEFAADARERSPKEPRFSSSSHRRPFLGKPDPVPVLDRGRFSRV